MKDEEFDALFESDAAKGIRSTAEQFPPAWYRIREGAPYAVSCSGTLVELIGYNNDRTVACIVHSKNKLPAAIAHEKRLSEKYNTPSFHHMDTIVTIDPIWLLFICRLEEDVVEKGK